MNLSDDKQLFRLFQRHRNLIEAYELGIRTGDPVERVEVEAVHSAILDELEKRGLPRRPMSFERSYLDQEEPLFQLYMALQRKP